MCFANIDATKILTPLRAMLSLSGAGCVCAWVGMCAHGQGWAGMCAREQHVRKRIRGRAGEQESGTRLREQESQQG